MQDIHDAKPRYMISPDPADFDVFIHALKIISCLSALLLRDIKCCFR